MIQKGNFFKKTQVRATLQSSRQLAFEVIWIELSIIIDSKVLFEKNTNINLYRGIL